MIVDHFFQILLYFFCYIFSDFSKYNSCGSSFLCDNKRCIDEDLTCDRVDHCGDYSDEAADGTARCGEKGSTVDLQWPEHLWDHEN